MTGYFRTIEDLERATYGLSAGSTNLLKATKGIHAPHDTLSGGDATLYNLVYVYLVNIQLSQMRGALVLVL